MTDEAIKRAAEAHFNQTTEFTEEEKSIAKAAFFMGAKWRINTMAVWHDASEKPNKNQLILFECRQEYGKGYSVTFGDNYEIIKSVLIRWTYIDDILPDGKGRCND